MNLPGIKSSADSIPLSNTNAHIQSVASTNSRFTKNLNECRNCEEQANSSTRCDSDNASFYNSNTFGLCHNDRTLLFKSERDEPLFGEQPINFDTQFKGSKKLISASIKKFNELKYDTNNLKHYLNKMQNGSALNESVSNEYMKENLIADGMTLIEQAESFIKNDIDYFRTFRSADSLNDYTKKIDELRSNIKIKNKEILQNRFAKSRVKQHMF